MPTTGTEGERRAARPRTRSQPAAQPAGPRPDRPQAKPSEPERAHGRELTVTIPLERAAELAAGPLSAAGRVLSSQGGLPVYVGLAVMAAAEVVAWPVAVAAGAGYAALRRWGPAGHARPRRAYQAAAGHTGQE